MDTENSSEVSDEISVTSLDPDYAREMPTVTDQFSGMTDRELTEWVARKLDYFERMATQAMQAADSNPMARMLMGNMFGGGEPGAKAGGILGLLGKKVV